MPGVNESSPRAGNLADNLVRTAAAHGGRSAVRLGDHTLTYAGLEAASAAVAGALRARGIGPGDRVGLMLPNLPQFPVLYYGILRVGAVVVPMNPLLKAREVAFYLRDSGARLLFAWSGATGDAVGGADQTSTELVVVDPATFTAEVLGTAPAVTEVVERAPEDTAVVLYTSGTTGQPKGAELTHRNLARNAAVVLTQLIDLSAEDVMFGGLPLFHSFGQTCTMNAAVAAGACVTLLPRFNPAEALGIIEAHRVTVLCGVPTMYGALLGVEDPARFDVTALRVCISGGAALPVEVLRRFEETFGCVVLEGYGLSETSPVASFNRPDRERKPGSIGTPIDGVEMRVVDEGGADVPQGEVGEIAIRGHNVMKGYWRRPQETAEAIPDGWFRTGDMARVDEDGYLFIVDRKKDVIIRGGYNVYPREVEEVLYEHPAVAEAAVIGASHADLGEDVVAVVVLRSGSTATPKELRDHVRRQLAGYKVPRRVWLVDQLPTGPTGKILKREIRLPTGG
jgi:long-chain acyl-CoA synthetase